MIIENIKSDIDASVIDQYITFDVFCFRFLIRKCTTHHINVTYEWNNKTNPNIMSVIWENAWLNEFENDKNQNMFTTLSVVSFLEICQELLIQEQSLLFL